LERLCRAWTVTHFDAAMILSFTQWLQSTGLLTYIRMSAYGFPVILSLHMVLILFFGGMILMTNMRLLGLAMRSYSISSVVEGLRLPKRWALVAMLTLGFLLFGSKATEYSGNVFFKTKVLLLLLIGVHHLAFRKSVYNNTAELDRTPLVPRRAKLAAILSLILWTSVAVSGRSIGYTPLSTTPVPISTLYGAPAGCRYFRTSRQSLRWIAVWFPKYERQLSGHFLVAFVPGFRCSW
jgi:hypothetical protein